MKQIITNAGSFNGPRFDSFLSDEVFMTAYHAGLLELQKFCKDQPQVELPLKHEFSPGVYTRQIFMPAGSFVIGKTHKTEHQNVVISGLARVMMDGKIYIKQGGDVFTSKAGTKKVLFILSDMVWLTIHPTNETDLDQLELMHVCTDEEEKELIKKELAHYAMQQREIQRNQEGDEERR